MFEISIQKPREENVPTTPIIYLNSFKTGNESSRPIELLLFQGSNGQRQLSLSEIKLLATPVTYTGPSKI